MSLKRFWATAVRMWWVVAASVILAIAAAMVAVWLRPTTYSASVTVLSTDTRGSSGIPVPTLSSSANDGYNRVLAMNDEVVDKTASVLGEDPVRLRASMTVDISTAGAVKLSVSADDPDEAQAAVVAWAEALTDWAAAERVDVYQSAIDSLRSGLSDMLSSPDFISADGDNTAATTAYWTTAESITTLGYLARTPTMLVATVSEPVAMVPGGTGSLVVSGTAGLVVGLALVLAFALVDTRVRTRADIARSLGVDVIGEVSMPGSLDGASRTSSSDSGFGALAVTVDATLGEREHGGPVLVTTLGIPGEDAWVAESLLDAFASIGRRSVLVGTGFSPDGKPGLAEVLMGTGRAEELIQSAHAERAWTLAAGRAESPSSVLGSSDLRETFASLNRQFDVVLVDVASPAISSDALLVARHSALSLLVVGEGTTEIDDVRSATERLLRVTDKPVVIALAHLTRRS